MSDGSVPGGHAPDDRHTGEQPPTDRLVGGRYRLLRRLGRGGMAVVWQARDEVLHRDVAVKEVLPPRDLSPGQRDEIRQRAMREARAAARLTHPSVVTVYDVVEDGGRPWIVMELLPARTLADVLATNGPLTPAVTARIGLELLDALRTAHAAGVLHRDVKPSNVMIADDGRAVLTDFGIATVEEDPSITATGMLVGSPGYMPPERARGEKPTPASDLWSLGATLFAATEGDPPFLRNSQLATLHAVISQDPPPAVHAGALQPLIARLLDRDPARRPDVDLAYQELHRIATGLPGAMPPPEAGPGQAPTEVIAAPAPTTTRPLPLGAPPVPPPPYQPPYPQPGQPAAYQQYGDPYGDRYDEGYGAPPTGPRTTPVRQPPERRGGAGAFAALAVLVVVAAAAIAYVLTHRAPDAGPQLPPVTTSSAPAPTTSAPAPTTSAPAPTTSSSAPTTAPPPTTTSAAPEPTTSAPAPTTASEAPPPSDTPTASPGDGSPSPSGNNG